MPSSHEEVDEDVALLPAEPRATVNEIDPPTQLKERPPSTSPGPFDSFRRMRAGRGVGGLPRVTTGAAPDDEEADETETALTAPTRKIDLLPLRSAVFPSTSSAPSAALRPSRLAAETPPFALVSAPTAEPSRPSALPVSPPTAPSAPTSTVGRSLALMVIGVLIGLVLGVSLADRIQPFVRALTATEAHGANGTPSSPPRAVHSLRRLARRF